MTKKRNTKRALLASILSMIMCVTMLIGSTFAWFTDNDTTAVNKIVAGNLDVEIVDQYGSPLDSMSFVNGEGKTDILWEPGATFRTIPFQILNNGNLALKFKVEINNTEVSYNKLNEVISFYLIDVNGNKIDLSNMQDIELLPSSMYTDKGLMYIEGHMDEGAGNDYMNLTLEGVAITVYATQVPHEYDSKNNTYDESATYDEVVAVTVDELAKILKEFADAGSGSNTIQLTTNYVLKEGETWVPVKVDGYNGADIITIEGNGMTISGLDAPLFAGGFAGGSGIVINDLTISNSNIVSTNTLGSGAFIETIDSMDVITLKNCHVKNSTISGSRTGGLIGWNSGYNNVNDGAVKTIVTIEDCTVTNCTIEGAGTVGGIIGHAGANEWTWNTIKNCKVENCTLTSNDDSYRVGAIVGTANVGHVTIEGCESNNNTIKQNNSGTEITRPEGQSALYGRFVPEGTGTLKIDGVEIK